MFSLGSFLVISAIMLVIGTIIGLVIGRSWVPPEQKRELEQRLSETQKELNRYQQSVAQHFMETSQKVSELTQSYRDLHEHLTKGALQLSNTEIGRELLAAGGATDISETLDTAHLEAPRDWAPKKPGNPGMLSEEFGLDDENDDSNDPNLKS